jgi:lipid-binding SYLF domain-containing protein
MFWQACPSHTTREVWTTHGGIKEVMTLESNQLQRCPPAETTRSRTKMATVGVDWSRSILENVMKKRIGVGLIAFLTTSGFAQSGVRSADLERLQSASVVLSQIMEAPDKAIPDSIMDGAKCIAIVPSMLNASFIFGANYGKGVATCRTTTGWSTPVFFRVEGGSFGFQAGGQASDLVLIIRTLDGMQYLLQSKFKLGANASAAAGPVGRDAQAATDLTMRAQILTYSRSRGLFAGVSVNGAVVHQDNNATQAFYKKDWTFYSLLNGEVPAPTDAQTFLKTVELYAPTPRVQKSARVRVPAPEATPAVTPAPSATSEPGSDVKSAPTPEAAPAAAPAPESETMPAEAPAASPSSAPVPTPSPTAAPAPTSSPDPSSSKQP